MLLTIAIILFVLTTWNRRGREITDKRLVISME